MTFRRVAPWVLASGLLGAALWRLRAGLVRYEPFVHDDAYITLRYARHLVEGVGPVWNPGERVEGYTSAAALLGVAALGALGVDLVVAARAVNLAGLALLAAAVGAFAWRRAAPDDRPLVAAIPSALAITCAPLLLWTQGGLEAPLFTGAVAVALALAVEAAERPTERRLAVLAALALGALPLVRPDGAAFAGAGAVAFALARGRAPRDLATFGGALVALPALQLAFRLVYYGAAMPNTVLAKATGLPPTALVPAGWAYLRGFVESPPWVVATSLGVGVALLFGARHRKAAALLLAAGLAHAASVVAAGGDHMPAHRLVLPLVAPALLVLGAGLAALTTADGGRRFAPVALLAALCGGAFAVRAQDDAYPPLPPDPAAYVGTVVGLWLAETYPPGTLVALNTAGSTPFHAPDLRFVDMLGLNDRRIASRRIEAYRTEFQKWPGHGKGDGAYVLERDPDVVIVGPAEGRPVTAPWFLGDLELNEDPRFHERYRRRRVEIPVGHLPHRDRYKATRDGSMTFTWYERVR